MENFELRQELSQILSSSESKDVIVEKTATFISEVFSVSIDEVAILKLDESEVLNFIWPVKLRTAGSVPLSALNPLASRTARQKTCFVNNSFAFTSHASFFECFKWAGSTRLPIQKIMSAPACDGAKVVGVVQVSRKGDAPLSCRDFSPEDLGLLGCISNTITSLLK
jgi:hypothetical protein